MAFLTDSQISERAERATLKISDARAKILHALVTLNGLEVDAPRYLAAVYRHDPPSRRLALARAQSGCGLVREWALEQAGLHDDRFHLGADVRAVRGGSLYPVTLEMQIAREKGALRKPDTRTRELPAEGDGLIIGCASCPGVWGKGGFAGEHMSTIVAVDGQVNGDAFTVDCIDGGQPGVHGRTRALVWCGPNQSELWAASLDDSGGYLFDAVDMRPTKGRRVLAWTDADALLT